MAVARQLRYELSERRRAASVADSSQPMTRLRKLDAIVINKVVISIHSAQLGKVICITFSDGTVQYHDRLSMEPLYDEISLDRVMSLNQVGFTFADESPCMGIPLASRDRRAEVPPGSQVAFSPTNCSFVQICEDGKVKWNALRYSPDMGSSMQDSRFPALGR